MSKKAQASVSSANVHKRSLKAQLHYYRGFYIMFIPVLVFALVFHYLPMLGIRYSFFTYKGIKDPVFIGLENFTRMFSMPGFWRAFSNTLVLSIVKLPVKYFYGSGHFSAVK